MEQDPNDRLPTVDRLLKKMFKEQKISFTKVPYLRYACMLTKVDNVKFSVGSFQTAYSSTPIWKRVQNLRKDCA